MIGAKLLWVVMETGELRSTELVVVLDVAGVFIGSTEVAVLPTKFGVLDVAAVFRGSTEVAVLPTKFGEFTKLEIGSKGLLERVVLATDTELVCESVEVCLAGGLMVT